MALAATVVVVPRFTSVGQAVQQLPELSILNAQVQQIALASQLNSPDFVGTVFAPINAVRHRAAADSPSTARAASLNSSSLRHLAATASPNTLSHCH
jgi:hypothetical protein